MNMRRPERPDLRVVDHDPGEAGDRSWEAVYRETVVLIYRYLYSRVGNKPDAEDLTSQVYMRALARLRLAASLPEIRSYLVATAKTVLADHWRDRYDVKLAELGDDVAQPPADDSPRDEEEGVRRADAVLARLPDNYRRVLELRFLRGYSIRETASALGITVNNAKILQYRALRRAATFGMET